MSATPRPKPSQTPELALSVQYGIRPENLPTRAQLRRWVLAALGRDANITLRLVGAREARALNRRFRGRDYATNVLTFAYPDQQPLAGDVALCAALVAREARARGVTREAHYAHLTVHGVLHLQGYDHERAQAAKRMEGLEARILARLGYANPYRAEETAVKPHATKPRLRTAAASAAIADHE